MADALFQISEPGESRVKGACAPGTTRAVGIDLGTTNSLIASVKNGRPVVLVDADGEAMVPSVVHYAIDGSGDLATSSSAKRPVIAWRPAIRATPSVRPSVSWAAARRTPRRDAD